MPSNFRTNDNDRTKTYRPLKSRFAFESVNDSSKKFDELNDIKDIKMTTTIRPRFKASDEVKEKEVVKTFYVSRHNRGINNTETKKKDDDNIEVKYNAIVHRRQRDVKNDNKINEKESKYASTKALFKVQQKPSETEPSTVGRNRRLRSVENNVSNKNDENRGYKYSISSSISNTVNIEFNKGNNEKKVLKPSISSRFMKNKTNDNNQGLKSSISSSINYHTNNNIGLKSSESNKGFFTFRTRESENNLTGKSKRLRSLDNKEEKDNDQKTNVNSSYASMIPRPFMNRKKKNNSVTALPLISLTESNSKNIDDKKKDKDKEKDKNKNKAVEKSIPSKTETNKTETQTDKKEVKKIPKFKKFERRISDENLKYKGNPETNENNNDIKASTNRLNKFGDNINNDQDKENGKREKSLGPKRVKQSEMPEISTVSILKYAEALSTPGRDDDGLKKTNQDSYVLEKNINGILNFNIFGVLDGHGVNGHFASQFVTKYIINRIKHHSLLRNLDTAKAVYDKIKSNEYQIITNIFIDADFQIKKQKFNVEMSGTTAVIVIQLDEHIICANTGDSRAILVYGEANKNKLVNTKIFRLSYDAKPDNPAEKKRIYENGGVVLKVLDENDEAIGPFRVWMKGKTYPGLAISRTIGDIDAKKIGVIPNPQFIEYTINPKTRYVIVCSDGIWEFMSNEEVMRIANNYYIKNDPAGLCHELTNKSTALWLKEDVCVDDITVVAAFF